MTAEHQIIERLRTIATDPAARGLLDDAAVLGDLVLTHDAIAEGVHYLPGDPPASVGWKLVSVNLSDLAAKGAEPAAALLSLTLAGNDGWTEAFVGGVAAACESYGLPLLGGDTISLPPGAPRVLGLTAIGRASGVVPSRCGGRPGDRLWIAGTIGDSAAGLALLRISDHADGLLVDAYRRPVPLLAAGRALAPQVTAMMDVSDGLLLDLTRLCTASGCGAEIDLDALPLSPAFAGARGTDRSARLFAATGGDDYALLAAASREVSLSLPGGVRMTCIGGLVSGSTLSLSDTNGSIALPEQLGHEHRTA